MRRVAVAGMAALSVATGCGRRETPLPAPLPELPQGTAAAGDRAGDRAALLPRPSAPRPDPGPPVTLAARDVEIRVLLLALAEAAGISMVVDPAITGRITVNFQELPAREAIEAVLAQAALGVAAAPPAPPIGPVVFYVVPVDIEEASAALIQARFDVGPEVARFIVRARTDRLDPGR